MKMNKSVQWILFVFILGSSVMNAARLYEERIYEPVVLTGGQAGADIKDIKGAPIDQLFLFTYKSYTWQMIPFQIDERVRRSDPDLSKSENDRIRHFYVIANTNSDYVFQDTLPGFDGDDELAFLIRDLGDKAPETSWIEDADSRNYPRVEILLTDPVDAESKAYGYLYRSATLTMPEEVANRYGMQFDPVQDLIQSNIYKLGMGAEKGFIKDIILNPPYGSGVDFFDAQKVRMNGYMDLGIGFSLYFGRNDASSATEAILNYFPSAEYQAYTEKPIVRVIRERRYSLGFAGISIPNTEFYLKTFNYPFSGAFVGGAQLDPASIREALGDSTVDLSIEIDYIRQSWDFNANASGMKFQSENNNDIMIDGAADTPDVTLTPDDSLLQTWSMATGDQGTLYNYYTFPKSSWDRFQLYYFDNINGGQADADIVNADDADYNEPGCYGENGLQFFKDSHLPDDFINLDFGFTAYIMPANQSRDTAEEITDWLENPVNISNENQEYTTVGVRQTFLRTEDYQLSANYPNPFNAGTIIPFTIEKSGSVQLALYDSQGRLIRQLLDESFMPGKYRITWDGQDHSGQTVSSGIYIVRLTTGNRQVQRKIIMAK